MRIAFLTLSFWPRPAGMEFVVHDLANALTDLGHDVVVFAPRVPGASDGGPPSRRYRFVPFGLGAVSKGRLPLLVGTFMRHQMRQRFDVINAHSAAWASRYAHVLKRLFRVPVVITCHGQDILRVAEVGYGRRLDPAHDQMIRDHLNRSDGVVAISEMMHQTLLSLTDEAKVTRIPNGVGSEAPEMGSVGFLRERIGEGGPTILSVGRNVPFKRFDMALRVFARVAEAKPTVRFVHIGRDGEALIELARQLGVADRFHPLGEIDREQVLTIYRESDVFLHASITEAFGLATSEAMAAGLPCVVSDAGANGEAVISGETGYVVPPDDERGMAEAVLDLLRDEPRRRQFGEAACRHIAARQSWPAVAAEYVRLFERVAAPAARRRAG